MSSYFLAHISIRNHEEYDKYLQGYEKIFSRFNGRVLAVDDHATVLEGEWPHQRTVLIRFPDSGELRRWYDSPEYQKLAAYRRRAATANIVIIEGRE